MKFNTVTTHKLRYHFVPANLQINDLNVILTGKGGTSILLHKVLNFYSLIVKKLINNMLFEDNGTRWVFINKFERRCLLGDSYIKITEVLVKAGLLIENKKWKHYSSGIGNYTKKYALPKHLFKGDKVFKRVEISENKSIQNMLKRFSKLRVDNSISDQWRDEMIKSSYRIMIHDTPESRKAIQEHIDNVNCRNTRYQLILSAADMIEIFNCSAIAEGTVDPFGRRAHHKISKVKKTIREFFFFENRPTERLTCIDIVNSQPMFMSVATPQLVQQFAPELTEAMTIVARYHDHEDVVKFRNICADGSIYETVMDYFKAHGHFISRDTAKKFTYTAFFGNYLPFELGKLKNEYKKLAYRFLKEQYNGMYRMFKAMKKKEWVENCKKVYANNCKLAQRLESQIFYTAIVPAVWNAGYRDFSTIHDSIIAPEKDCDAIREIMLMEFQKLNIKLQLAA